MKRLLVAMAVLLGVLASSPGTLWADGIVDGEETGVEENPPWYVSELVSTSRLPDTVGTFTIAESTGQVIVELFAGNSVVMKGYRNEPFMKMEPSGEIFYNSNSISSYANLPQYFGEELAPSEIAEAEGDDLEPNWVSTETKYTMTWLDYRLQWLYPEPPPVLGPGNEVNTWEIIMVANDEEYVFAGRTYFSFEIADQYGVDYSAFVPPWWESRLLQAGAGVVLISLTIPLVVMGFRSRARRKAPRVLPDPAELRA